MRFFLPGKAIIAVALVTLVGVSIAQTFPTRPLRIIVPYAPGGIVEFVARTMSPRLSAKLGQPVVIENKPGAAGAIAMDALKQSPADGHTLLLVDPALVINSLIQPKLSYRAARDMQGVSLFASTGLILAVHPRVPATAKDASRLLEANEKRWAAVVKLNNIRAEQ
jgi:tripartite-type tricarboxylate transporter receptor subunit TctC